MMEHLEIRKPRTNDIEGIVEVVAASAPFLSTHVSYIHWIALRYHRDTCAVAEIDGHLVGWCSVLTVPGPKYLLHQLGVEPHARRMRVAQALLLYVLKNLRETKTTFELEFTMDRHNAAAHRLVRNTAEEAGMRLQKQSEIVRLVEQGCEEELYVMTPNWCGNRKEGNE